MAGRRLQSEAKLLGFRILQTEFLEGTGLKSLLGLSKSRKPSSTTYHGVMFRSLFLIPRGEGSNALLSQRKNPRSYFHGRTVGPPDDSSTEEKTFKYWPASWLKEFSGRLQSLEIDEVLNRVKSRKRKDLWVASSFVHRRRIVQNTSRRYQKNGENISSVLEAGVKYNVIRIDSDGRLQYLELKPAQLGVHPRDVDLLSSSTFIPQRATIAVQRDKVLVRMENVRAIVCKDHVLLFDAHHPRVAKEGVSVPPGPPKDGNSPHTARDAFAEALAQQAKDVPCDSFDPMPFHLRVMESLLEEASNYFHQKVDRLKLVVERILQELTHDVSIGGLQTLLPLKRAVTEIEHDVRDAHQAMDQVLSSDENLQALCLVNDNYSPSEQEQQQDAECEGGPQTSGNREDHFSRLRQATVDMLFTYQREVDDAGGVLEELRKGMEAAQEVWELGLDATRNRIIRMNLYISMFTCTLSLGTLPAAFFGMNLPSGLEEHPTMFYWVVGLASTSPLIMLGGIVLTFRVWPRIVDRRRAQDLTGLLNLLRHLDTVDDIFEAVIREVKSKKITRKEFHKLLKAHNLTQCMRQKELDLIFRMFDRNHNEVLDAEELRSSSSACKHSSSPHRHR